MVSEEEPKKFTRRQFLKGLGALGASALLSSCGPEKSSSQKTPSPDKEPSPTLVPTRESSPTPKPTLTPEPTATPEAIRLPASIITADYLREAFADIGGQETVTNGEEEASLINFGQDYVSSSWGEEIGFENLPQNPIGSLKYLLSLGAYQGVEGVFTPGRNGEEVVFPKLGELSLTRLTLEKVPSVSQEEEEEGAAWVSPRGLTLRPETQMTVVGLLEEESPRREETAVGNNNRPETPGHGHGNNDKLSYALVAFTDYLRADEETNVPRHYLALIPTHFPQDPDNQSVLTLANLLGANGREYLPVTSQISLIDQKTNRPTLVELNRLVGEELTGEVREATGLYFVDQLNNKLIKNPVVPYPEEMPQVWAVSPQKDEQGNFFLLLSSQDEKGEMIPYAKASYNLEKEEWGWSFLGPKLGEVIEREGERFQRVEIEGQTREVLLLEGLTLTWNEQEKHFEYLDSEGQKVAHWLWPEDDQEKGGLEITPLKNKEGLPYLDFEKHASLFSPISAEEGNRIFTKYFDETKEVRIPIPLDVRGGGVIEVKKIIISAFCFGELPAETVVYAPVDCQQVARGGLERRLAHTLTFSNEEGDFLSFLFSPQGEFLLSGNNVQAGEAIIKLGGDHFPAEISYYRRYQLVFGDERGGRDSDFDNLTRDSFGRITYLAGE